MEKGKGEKREGIGYASCCVDRRRRSEDSRGPVEGSDWEQRGKEDRRKERLVGNRIGVVLSEAKRKVPVSPRYDTHAARRTSINP